MPIDPDLAQAMEALDGDAPTAEVARSAQFMAKRAFEELRKANEARRLLEADHNLLLAHTAELLERARRMDVRLRELQQPQGCREDEVAEWLKARGWLVSRPITIEGEAT